MLLKLPIKTALKLIQYKRENPSAHGGALSIGCRKTKRIVSTKCSMHVTLKSERAIGKWSMLNSVHYQKINFLIKHTAKQCRVRLHGAQIMGNHIHLHIQVKNRRDWNKFLRVLPQRIMFLVTGARRGKPKGKFWTFLAFSRVVEWGAQYYRLKIYFWKNSLQALGVPKSMIKFLAQKKYIKKAGFPPPLI